MSLNLETRPRQSRRKLKIKANYLDFSPRTVNIREGMGEMSGWIFSSLNYQLTSDILLAVRRWAGWEDVGLMIIKTVQR